MLPLVGSTRRRTLRATVDLPQPDFADKAECFPDANRKADAIDRMHGADFAAQDAASHRIVLDEVRYLEQGARVGHGDLAGSAARQHAAR